jgi:hypothetical protein
MGYRHRARCHGRDGYSVGKFEILVAVGWGTAIE